MARSHMPGRAMPATFLLWERAMPATFLLWERAMAATFLLWERAMPATLCRRYAPPTDSCTEPHP